MDVPDEVAVALELGIVAAGFRSITVSCTAVCFPLFTADTFSEGTSGASRDLFTVGGKC